MRQTIVFLLFFGLLVALLVSLAVSPPAATPTSSTPAPTSEPACTSPETVPVTATLTVQNESPDNRTLVRVEYYLSPNVSEFTVHAARGVVKTEEFTGDGSNWTATTHTPTLWLSPSRVSPNTKNLPQIGQRGVLMSTPQIALRWRTQTSAAPACLSMFPRTQTELPPRLFTPESASVTYTQRMLYAHPDSPLVETVPLEGNGSLRVVVSRSSALAHENHSEIVTELTQLDAKLDVGCQRNLTVFAVPRPYTDTGGWTTQGYIQHGRTNATAWVDAGAFFGVGTNTWLHEYVHSRQCVNAATEMDWLNEGSARYYETNLMYRHVETLYGTPSMDDEAYPNATLTRPETWNSSKVEYEKGGKAVYYIDYQLRTHGNHTFDDVMAWVNRRNGTLTYTAFRQQVVRWTDAETGAWMDAHIADDDVITLTPQMEARMRTELRSQAPICHDCSEETEQQSPTSNATPASGL